MTLEGFFWNSCHRKLQLWEVKSIHKSIHFKFYMSRLCDKWKKRNGVTTFFFLIEVSFSVHKGSFDVCQAVYTNLISWISWKCLGSQKKHLALMTNYVVTTWLSVMRDLLTFTSDHQQMQQSHQDSPYISLWHCFNLPPLPSACASLTCNKQ